MDFYTLQLGWYFQKKFIEFFSALWYFDIECKLMAYMRTWHCTAQKSIIYSPLSVCINFIDFSLQWNESPWHTQLFFILLQWTFVKPNWNITNLPFFFHFSNFNFSSSKIKTKKNTKIKKFADFRSFWFHTHTLKSNDKKIKLRLLRKITFFATKWIHFDKKKTFRKKSLKFIHQKILSYLLFQKKKKECIN